MADYLQSRGTHIDQVYQRALFNIFSGRTESPRGMYTKEILGHQVILDDVRNNVLVCPARDLNPKFMVAEWLWITLGLEDVATISQYNSNIAQFSDDGLIFNGAYGPRILNQANYIMRVLKTDRATRQAVLTIWQPNPKHSKDIPCTIDMQFLFRDDRLHLHVTMRSSDGWLGLPYDMYNFSQLCNYVARLLLMEPGSLVMTLGSSHLYERDWEKAQAVIGSVSETWRSPLLDRSYTSWEKRGEMYTVKDVLRRPKEATWGNLAEPWGSYCRVLAVTTRQKAWEVLRQMSERGGDDMDEKEKTQVDAPPSGDSSKTEESAKPEDQSEGAETPDSEEEEEF